MGILAAIYVSPWYWLGIPLALLWAGLFYSDRRGRIRRRRAREALRARRRALEETW